MTTPFDWSEDHREIRQLLRRRFAALDPVQTAREALDGMDLDSEVALWRDLCGELGLAGLTLPEDVGGLGLGRIELSIVGEEMGRVLLGGPFASTVVFAAEAVLASADPVARRELLPQIVDGSITAALAVAETSSAWGGSTTRFDRGVITGTKRGVIGAVGADQVIVSAQDEQGRESLYVVAVDEAADQVSVVPSPGIDATRSVSTVTFAGAPARLLGSPGGAPGALEQVREHAVVFFAAEQAAGAQACVEITAEYARSRIQFGQPIGRFQGVKHRLADMEVRAYQSHSAAVWAAWQAPGSSEARMATDVARLWCSDAYVQNAFDMIQLHGGIAITWEHDAHLYVRRAQADAAMLGSRTLERQRLAETLGTATAGGTP